MFLYAMKIAFNFLKSPRKETLYFLISILSKLGIIIAVSVLTIGLGITNILNDELKNKIFSIIPHIEVKMTNSPYINWKDDFINISNVLGIVNVIPYIEMTAFIEKNNSLKIAKIIGINTNECKFKKYIFNSELDLYLKKLNSKKNEIILGYGIAKELNILPGETIGIIIPNYINNSQRVKFYYFSLKVIAILKFNNILDYKIANMHLNVIQKYLNYNNSITGFQIRTDNCLNSYKKIHEIDKIIKNNLVVQNWTENYGYLYEDINIIRNITFITMILLIIISCFNVFSSLFLVLANKLSDILILRIIGAKNNFILSIFVWYTLILGLRSYLIGTLLGIFVSLNLNKIIKFIETIWGHKVILSDIGFVDFSILNLIDMHMLYILILSLFPTVIAGIYPFMKSIRTNPIKIISSKI